MEMNVFKMYYYKKRFIFKNIKQFLYNLKYAWQRITRGYADCDVYNLDWFLEQVLKGALIKLANTTYSYPDTYENLESWQEDLKRISELVDLSNVDNRLSECYDENMCLIKDKYLNLIEECVNYRNEIFDWLKINMNHLWD